MAYIHDLQVVNIQGYLSFAVYIHYLVPGSFKLQSIIRIPITKENVEPLFQNTRRWLQKGEAPYPGYCRAPGSSECLPLLCNCMKLQEIWLKAKETEARLKLNIVS